MNDKLRYPPITFGSAADYDAFLASKISGTTPHSPVSPTILPEMISMVIPVKDNESGVRRLIDSVFSNMDKAFYPREIIVIDNNSSTPLRIDDHFPVPVVVHSCKTIGPAAARNMGAFYAKGDWILFVDSDCVATPSLVSGYLSENNACIAYSGMVKLTDTDYLTNFYRDQNTLVPAVVSGGEGLEPCYLVTANCLVLKSAFLAVGGFNESLTSKVCGSGGEDTEIGFRLRLAGKLRFNWQAEAEHKFEDGFDGFVGRFIRYGFGDRAIEKLYGLRENSMRPVKPKVNNPTQTNLFLADVAHAAMLWGFEEKGISGFPLDEVVDQWCEVQVTSE